MELRRLTASELHARQVRQLGLDPDALDLTSVEAIAGALRRMASILCPCPRSVLVRSVVRPLRGLVDDIKVAKRTVENTLAAMIAYGDILEYPDVEEDSEADAGIVLYPAPRAFVVRKSGTILLVGVTSDHSSALPDELANRLDYANRLRFLRPRSSEDLRTQLLQLGLIELNFERWLHGPTRKSAAQHLSVMNGFLDKAQPSHDVPGLVILDPARQVGYYRGRWTEALSHTGRFVARRSQAYGNKLWCYIKLRDGNPEKIIDFPLPGSEWRGCDDAWHLQMAIDAKRGVPQQFRVSPGPENTRVIQFFSPVPMWAQRRWDAIGVPIPASGCLFAYRLANVEFAEETNFIRDTMWLEELKET